VEKKTTDTNSVAVMSVTIAAPNPDSSKEMIPRMSTFAQLILRTMSPVECVMTAILLKDIVFLLHTKNLKKRFRCAVDATTVFPIKGMMNVATALLHISQNML
jgi:hypothetical protein